MHIGSLMNDRMSSDYFVAFIRDSSNLNICTDLVTFPWQEEPSLMRHSCFQAVKRSSVNYIFHKTIQHAGGALN